MFLRPANVADVAAYIALRNQSIVQQGPKAYRPEEVQTWLALDNAELLSHAFENFPGQIAYDNQGNILGFAVVKGDELSKLFTIPGAGAGQLLLQWAIGQTAEHGGCFVDASLNSVGFYERHGFTTVLPRRVHDYRLLVKGGTFFPTTLLYGSLR